jgi:26S proteasome regulatory subunit, ATPase 3, interacting protein
VSVQKLRDQIKVYKSKNTTIDPAEQKKVEKQYEKYATAYRKRKRMCTDMLDAILEGYPKTKKHLLEEVGVETDEDAKFVMSKI